MTTNSPRSPGVPPPYVSPRASLSQSELYSAAQPRSDRPASDRYEYSMTDVNLAESPATPTRHTPQHRSAFSQHQRQHSTPTFPLPQSAPRSPSPLRSHISIPHNDMPYTGDGQGHRQLDAQAGGFGGWLRRPSTPSAHDGPLSPDTTPKSARAPSINLAPTKTTPQSKLGLFASSVTAFAKGLGNQMPTQNVDIDDELYNMDIEATLFPVTSPTDHDAFSPSAYKNLQTNATGLLLKMQTAYRQRTLALQDIQGERDAQREEIEETKLRIALFKTQLEDMATKATEHEKEMQRLVNELRTEKKARQDERVARAASSIVSEDLEIDEEDRRKWRESSGTVKSDVSMDTDIESGTETESLFSRSRSPTVITSITDTEPPASSRPASLHAPKIQLTRQLSTFQKIVKGIAGDAEGMGTDGCRNCRGKDSSVAWDTVSLLRDENKGLKHRVAQLEVAVEGALDLVNGIGLD